MRRRPLASHAPRSHPSTKPRNNQPGREGELASKAILLNVSDNVATALTALAKGDKIHAQLEDVSVDVVLREDIQFAHKYALRDIAKGEPVLKYGMPIGNALEDIRAGDWVHVHNCRSQRFGFHRQQYGLKA
jgi:altronate dehydratase small subunit